MDIELCHHGHVFVLEIMAVKDIWPGEVPEVHGDLHLIVGSKVDGILQGIPIPLIERRYLPIPTQDMQEFQVDVDGVDPATGFVHQTPPFGGIDGEPSNRDTEVHELTIDGQDPLSRSNSNVRLVAPASSACVMVGCGRSVPGTRLGSFGRSFWSLNCSSGVPAPKPSGPRPLSCCRRFSRKTVVTPLNWGSA